MQVNYLRYNYYQVVPTSAALELVLEHNMDFQNLELGLVQVDYPLIGVDNLKIPVRCQKLQNSPEITCFCLKKSEQTVQKKFT